MFSLQPSWIDRLELGWEWFQDWLSTLVDDSTK
jgi:hypothetical protein